MKDTVTSQIARLTVGNTTAQSVSLGHQIVTEADSGLGEGGSEVVSHYEGRLFTTNGAGSAVNVYDADTGALDFSIDLTAIEPLTGYGFDGVQSVTAGAGGIAVAIGIENAAEPSPAMLNGENGWSVNPLFTVGATLDNGYQPVGVMDGIGAMELDANTVRIFVNHELGAYDGNSYSVDGITLTGARISYFDVDKASLSIVDGGLAITAIVDAAGNRATDASFTFEDKPGFERFCSSVLVEGDAFGVGMGTVDAIYFTGEETGGAYSGVGGAEWALDVDTGTLYAVPALGRGAWENVTQIDTGTTTHVAFVLADDTAPFDADGDGAKEAAPLFMYVGEKDTGPDAGFLARNGLDGGTVFVWVGDAVTDPEDFNGNGAAAAGHWEALDMTPGTASNDGATGFDEWGYPTQSNLWTQAEALGAFGFSRPEDVATNPDNGAEFVLASTGRSADFNGADQIGTIYTFTVDFTDITRPTATANILYDGDDTTDQPLRSPDNLDWADDGMIYVQEDRAISGIFGDGAVNPNDASIVQIDPSTGTVTRVAEVDQSVWLPFGTIEEAGGADVGRWESSGIVDVSTLFGYAPGTLMLADVQAHGLDDQDRFDIEGPGAALVDGDLKEGGQLVFLGAPGTEVAVQNPAEPVYAQPGVIAFYDLDGNLGTTVQVGNLPDMVTWSHDGTMVFVANEGEKQGDQDPAGSISIITAATGEVRTFGFEAFNDQADALAAAGVRLFPGETPATDFEPEYIAEGSDGRLYVTLQEANAVAVFDLATMAWADILPLGTSDHSVEGFGIDPSDKDGVIDIHTVPVQGLRMPDAIATAEIDGQVYFLTANEGDDRGDWDEGGDAARVGDILAGDIPGLSIDESVDTTGLERLNVSIIDGDTDGDGDIDVLHSYGARSFTIYDAAGNVVFDSGDDFETIISQQRPANAFNNDGYPSGDADTVDENRSDNKGPEPEAIATGVVDGRTLAFVGLERDSGIMIYDITDPANAAFLSYIDNGSMGHISPEVIDFIPAADSLTGFAQIAVSFEVSGTTVLFDIQLGQDITGSVRSDAINGTLADDFIFAGNGFDTVDAGAGNDVIHGAQGSDSILAGTGDDTIYGGQARDTIAGGAGDDVMNGGQSRDVFVFDIGDGDDTIINLERIDTIDMAATGLTYDDLTVTHLHGRTWLVEYGDQGDSIEVILDHNNPVLNANDFDFGLLPL